MRGAWVEGTDVQCGVRSKLWRERSGMESLTRKRNEPQVLLMCMTPLTKHSRCTENSHLHHRAGQATG